MTKVGLYAIGTCTTLESNKSLAWSYYETQILWHARFRSRV